nr:M23 family metallopeptidase [Leifsonia psychrotolerans]
MVVAADAVTVTIHRDGFSSAAAPAPAPAPVVAAASAPAGQPVSSGWVLPVVGHVSDHFGPRPEAPVAGVNPFHSGTDIAAPSGSPVVAASGGTVIFAGMSGSLGNWVLIDHGNGIETGYAHNSEILVSVGETVAAGQTISRVGSTGAATGPHLHFEVHVDGTQVDAETFMSERGISLG